MRTEKPARCKICSHAERAAKAIARAEAQTELTARLLGELRDRALNSGCPRCTEIASESPERVTRDIIELLAKAKSRGEDFGDAAWRLLVARRIVENLEFREAVRTMVAAADTGGKPDDLPIEVLLPPAPPPAPYVHPPVVPLAAENAVEPGTAAEAPAAGPLRLVRPPSTRSP